MPGLQFLAASLSVLLIAGAFALLGYIIVKLKTRSPYSKSTFEAIWEIEKVVLETTDFDEATHKVVNIILTQLGYLKYGYQVIVLTLLDQQKGVLKRIAISETEAAGKFLKASPIPFQNIEIPLTSNENLSVKAISDKQIKVTDKVADVLYPALSRKWVEDFQKQLGIKTSIVFPVTAKEKVLGALIFSLNKERSLMKPEEWTILESFVGSVGIALDNALLFKSLKSTTEQLAFANTRLKELDKLKDDFVSVASHELRTPMTAIKSYLWMGLNKYGKLPTQAKSDLKSNGQTKLPEDLQKYMSRAYISVERLINLVNDMLNISRIESGRIALRLTDVDLVQLANDVIDEVKAKAAEKDIKLKLNVHIYPKVLADPDKIHEVYLNLIGNALKFTPTGGTVTVDFKEKLPFIYVSITDTGVGIHKEDISRLFTKFGRLDNSYVASASSGGTGLGLFISKSLVEIHKGTILATSEGENRGTTFTFSLPIIGTEIATKLHHDAPQETADTKDLEKTSVNVI